MRTTRTTASGAPSRGYRASNFNDAGEVTLEVDYHHGGQGIVDSWVAHWNARRAMKWEELGAITGA